MQPASVLKCRPEQWQTCLDTYLAPHIIRKTGTKIKYLASVIMGGALILFGMGNLGAAVLCFCGIGLLGAMVYPVGSSELNTRLESGQRATIISIRSMMILS